MKNSEIICCWSKSQAISNKYPVTITSKWELDIGEISEEQWGASLGAIRQLSTSESLCISHLYLVHRVYRTPMFLQIIEVGLDAKCPRCFELADTMHMF